MIFRNKYNNKNYKVIEVKDNQVTLERNDGTRFTISKNEFSFYYTELKPEKK